MICFFMIIVVTQFKANIQNRKKTNTNPNSQTNNIDDAVGYIPDDIAKGNF